MQFSQLKNQYVWITGASTGIGLQLAVVAAQSGAKLLLISSRDQALEQACQLCMEHGALSVNYAAIDLAHAQNSFESTQQLLTQYGVPDFLILNAGISQRSVAAESQIHMMKRVMDINFFGAVAVCRAVLPVMVDAGGGHIAVTSSLVGRFGFPYRSIYSASKHALHGYFESLYLEYVSTGIQITLVLPGRIHTDISLRALDAKGEQYNTMDRGHARGMSVQKCANLYWKGFLKGRFEVHIGSFAEKLILFLHKYGHKVFLYIAGRVNPL